jgi:hypothetical protein
MPVLVGTPSDAAPKILATGHIDFTTVFVSMTARHPEGRDADYIEWHCLDQRPEMHRLASMRASLRLVSTPACRAARAASEGPYDGVDHVMTYLMASDTDAALEEFKVRHGPADHLLLSRRRPRRHGRTAPSRPGEAMGGCRSRPAPRGSVSHDRAVRVGSLRALMRRLSDPTSVRPDPR